MTQEKVRVRFAPSPTGQVHVGNARTALFNWLFARQKGGTYVLRIEDTDVERSEARYETQLLDDMKWLGIDWDEGPDVGGPFPPYRQSERLDIYHQYAGKLLEKGKAYLCFCPADVLEQEREKALAEHRPPMRSCPCAEVDPAELQKRRAAGESAAIRLKIPDHPIRFHDIVRGWVEFPPEAVADPIIVRSTGMPVYNYVVVVDDALMEITHVIRGDDHLSNTPKQVVLYEAFGWKVPEFAHLSTILGADRQRLSKRHGAVSIANFRDSGVLPEALFNYLALLGWAPSGGDREIFSKEELVKEFDLGRVTPSAAVFDVDKLNWLNRHYIKEAAPERLAALAQNYWDRMFRDSIVAQTGLTPAAEVSKPGYGLSDEALEWLKKITALLAPSVDRLEQLPERASLIFAYDPVAATMAPDNAEVLSAPNTARVLDAFAAKIAADAEAQAQKLSPERFKAIVNEVKTETGVKGKDLFHPIRVALTGSHSGPEFDKLVPILEEGSRLKLPKRVLSVRERIEAFQAARTA
ncbi:MAG TPA: glutamate--tRNA ligase [Terriglobales bacterium]|nr:glutamate--tRNA ligase [Terriglobales bacterium]